MHSIFSLAQLESSPDSNLFNRSISDHPDLVFMKGDTSDLKLYIIERLFNKRVRHTASDREIIKYLVK